MDYTYRQGYKGTIIHRTTIHMKIMSGPRKLGAVFKDSIYMEGLKILQGRDSLELIHDLPSCFLVVPASSNERRLIPSPTVGFRSFDIKTISRRYILTKRKAISG